MCTTMRTMYTRTMTLIDVSRLIFQLVSLVTVPCHHNLLQLSPMGGALCRTPWGGGEALKRHRRGAAVLRKARKRESVSNNNKEKKNWTNHESMIVAQSLKIIHEPNLKRESHPAEGLTDSRKFMGVGLVSHVNGICRIGLHPRKGSNCTASHSASLLAFVSFGYF